VQVGNIKHEIVLDKRTNITTEKYQWQLKGLQSTRLNDQNTNALTSIYSKGDSIVITKA
jgi:hypothetical protein